MRETKLHDLARRNLRAFGDGGTDSVSGASWGNAAAKRAIATPEPTSNLPTLKALISNHRTMLVNVRRSNQLLENDNMRLERELAARSRKIVQSTAAGEQQAPIATDNANAKLAWIENYIHCTLAQTLWALNARAMQLEEQVTSVDQQQQTHRLLEMTHDAYDQLRELMDWLHGNAHD
jgi:replicative DNA helicase